MDKIEQRVRAKEFQALHRTPPLLQLANVWDVSSAKVFELAGLREPILRPCASSRGSAWRV